MNKPDCIKKLALISALLTGIYFAISIILIINPQIAASILGNYYTSDIEIGFSSEVKTFLILKEMAILPLAAMAIYIAASKKFSNTHGVVSVTLSSVIYVIASILFNIINASIAMLASQTGGTSALVTVNIVNTSKSFFNYFLFAALILLCCASAVEMYAAKHNISDNNTLEKTD